MAAFINKDLYIGDTGCQLSEIAKNEGTWTPTIDALNETAPTVTYTSRRGKYKKIGNIVFISFYIRAKITVLNGTNNYAIITGLPYSASNYALGEYSATPGALYSALNTNTNIVLLPYGNYIRVQCNYGSSATKWIVTTTSYMEVAGSGFYFIS